MKKRDSTLPDGIGLLAVALFIAINTSQISLSNWREDTLSPHVFPYFIAACIGFMGLMLTIKGALALAKAGPAPATEEAEKTEEGRIVIALFGKRFLVHPSLFLVVASLLLLWSLKTIGFLIMAPIFVGIVLFALGMPLKKSVFLAVSVVVVIYLVFTLGFKVTLPMGVLKGIL